MGSSFAISGNGNVIVLGYSFEGSNKGQVQVYQYNDGSLELVDGIHTPDDTAQGDWFGNAVAISYDGSVVAVGAPYKSTSTGYRSGAVMIFQSTSLSTTEPSMVPSTKPCESLYQRYTPSFLYFSLSNDYKSFVYQFLSMLPLLLSTKSYCQRRYVCNNFTRNLNLSYYVLTSCAP